MKAKFNLFLSVASLYIWVKSLDYLMEYFYYLNCGYEIPCGYPSERIIYFTGMFLFLVFISPINFALNSYVFLKENGKKAVK